MALPSSGLIVALIAVLWPKGPALVAARGFIAPSSPSSSGNGLSKEHVEIVLAKCQQDTSVLDETDHAHLVTSYDRCSDQSGPGEHIPVLNTGREAGTYLSHIVANYDNLAEWTVFTQGDKAIWASDVHHKAGVSMVQGHHYVDAHANRHERPRYFIFTEVINIDDPPPRSLYSSSRTGIVEGQDEQPQMCFDESSDWSLLPTPFTKMVEQLQTEQNASIGGLFNAKLIPALFDISPAHGTMYFAQGATFAASREAIRSRPKAYYSKLADMINKSSDPWIAYHLDWAWYYVIGGENAPCGTEKRMMEASKDLLGQMKRDEEAGTEKQMMEYPQSLSRQMKGLVADCTTCTDGYFRNSAGYDCEAMRTSTRGRFNDWQGMTASTLLAEVFLSPDGELAAEACVHFACPDCAIQMAATAPVGRRSSSSGSGSGSGSTSSMPSAQPSDEPSTQPSSIPSAQPSSMPSAQPSSMPSAQPSDEPSTQPSSMPSTQPSSIPSAQPSSMPSAQPSSMPSAQPSDEPSTQPSSMPSAQPSDEPSTQPTTDAPSTQPSSPTVGYTDTTQTIEQNIPGVDSAAIFNANVDEVRDAYQKGYAFYKGITDTASNGAIDYKTGCSVTAFAVNVNIRRGAMSVSYSSVVSDASGVDTTTANNGVTDTSAFATAVATVVASDTTTYASVTAPSATDIISVGVTVATYVPSSSDVDGRDSSAFEFPVWAIFFTGFMVIMIALAIIVFVVLRRRRANDAESRKSSTDSSQTATSPYQDCIEPATDTQIELVVQDERLSASTRLPVARKARSPVA